MWIPALNYGRSKYIISKWYEYHIGRFEIGLTPDPFAAGTVKGFIRYVFKYRRKIYGATLKGSGPSLSMYIYVYIYIYIHSTWVNFRCNLSEVGGRWELRENNILLLNSQF